MGIGTILLLAALVPSVYDLEDPTVDHTAQAIELDESGDIEGAVQSFRAAAKFEDSSEAWANLGMILSENLEGLAERESDEEQLTEEAISCFNKAIQRNPSNWEAKEELLKLMGSSACGEEMLRVKVSKADRKHGRLPREVVEQAKRTFKECGVVVLQGAYKDSFVKELLKEQTAYFDEYLERQEKAKKLSEATGTDSDTAGELR
jgi:tetratricopeptide (TPR) repeat protein